MHNGIAAYSDPPQPPRPLTLPLLPDAYTFGYPKEVGKAPKIQYYSLAPILTRAWTTDAHFTAYHVPAWPYRLSRDAIHLDGGVVMVLFISDVDCGFAHKASRGHGDAPAPDGWWMVETSKLTALRQACPGAFIYRTRRGYRVVFWLPTPRVLRSLEDAQQWSADYLAWVAAFRQCFNIFGDPSCCDWQRLYRAPHATRTPRGRPEARETVGSPYQIGLWTCEPTIEERELAKTLAKRPSARPRRELGETSISGSDGVFFYAFRARGWMGHKIDEGKWAVQCPWTEQHTKGKPLDTSTVLYAPGAGDTLGWLHCSHAHCQAKDTRDVLKCFSRQEITDAERAAGLPPFMPITTVGTSGQHCFSAKRGLRTVETKAVLARRSLGTIDTREVSAWQR